LGFLSSFSFLSELLCLWQSRNLGLVLDKDIDRDTSDRDINFSAVKGRIIASKTQHKPPQQKNLSHSSRYRHKLNSTLNLILDGHALVGAPSLFYIQ